MFCNNSHQLLIDAANRYTRLGYQVGLTKGKSLIGPREMYVSKGRWDGISIMLDGLVCVDLDAFTSLDKQYELPQTLKERSPRGLHFFYRLPDRFNAEAKIGWKHKIDLLTITSHSTSYGKSGEWKGHVLCSPSKGYTRLYPGAIPAKAELTMAPNWLLDNIVY